MEDKIIKVHTDKRGTDHVDIYTKDPKDDEHKSIHINIKDDGSGTIVDNTEGNKEITHTHCFLTTACLAHKEHGFDDKCYELEMLRWFRDRFVTIEDKVYYYDVAPRIIDEINKKENYKQIYELIYYKVVYNCVYLIEKGKYSDAYVTYKKAVLELENEFLSNKTLIKEL